MEKEDGTEGQVISLDKAFSKDNIPLKMPLSEEDIGECSTGRKRR